MNITSVESASSPGFDHEGAGGNKVENDAAAAKEMAAQIGEPKDLEYYIKALEDPEVKFEHLHADLMKQGGIEYTLSPKQSVKPAVETGKATETKAAEATGKKGISKAAVFVKFLAKLPGAAAVRSFLSCIGRGVSLLLSSKGKAVEEEPVVDVKFGPSIPPRSKDL